MWCIKVFITCYMCSIAITSTYGSSPGIEVISSLFAESGCLTGVLMSVPEQKFQQMVAEQESSNNTSYVEPQLEIEEGTCPLDEPDNCMQSEEVSTGKEKTATSLITELATFNKISHQYKVIKEEGPSHAKQFTVSLSLGDEQYTGAGFSIKNAKQAAATEALKKTSYEHPVLRTKDIERNITAVAELNELAMKLGESAVYKTVESKYVPVIQETPLVWPSGFRLGRRRRFSRGRRSLFTAGPQKMRYTVSLTIGKLEFKGEGDTVQAARHDAAAKALSRLREVSRPANDKTESPSLISPVSLVYEIASKQNLPVNFEIVSETGPSHMKVFITKCTVGDMVATGEGDGKKSSKKNSAESMLEHLKTISDIRFKRKAAVMDQYVKETNLKENPISKLNQIQQRKRETPALYTFLGEKNGEFVIEVLVGDIKATGSGRSKKSAKRNAAYNLLKVMGYTFEEESVEAQVEEEEDNSIYSKFNKKNSHQLLPGLIFISSEPFTKSSSNKNAQLTATIAKELLERGESQTAKIIKKQTYTNKLTENHLVRSEDKLLFLADLMKFQTQFSDFPNSNHTEYLSLVSLSTEPPQVCHGSGATLNESRDRAASTALKSLSARSADAIVE